MLFFGLQLDQELASVTDHKCGLFVVQYVPPDITNISQVGPLVKFPAQDWDTLCKAPLDFLKKQVPIEKRRTGQAAPDATGAAGQGSA